MSHAAKLPAEVKPATPAEMLAALRAEPGRLYAVLDPAQDERVLEVLRCSGQPAFSLYDGWAAVQYRTLCPYLVPLRRRGRLIEQIVERGWLRAWGIFLASEHEPAAVRRHLRRMLRLRAASREMVLFRFYDPLTAELFLTDPGREFEPWLFGDVARAYVLESHLGEPLTLRPDPARAAAEVRWPMALTQLQTERHAARRRGFFIDQIERFIREDYDDRTVRLPLSVSVVRDLPRAQLREMIDKGLRRAEARAVTDPHDQLAFVGMMFLKAPNFDDHLVMRDAIDAAQPGYPMMKSIIERADERVWRDVADDYDPAAWGLGLRTWGGV